MLIVTLILVLEILFIFLKMSKTAVGGRRTCVCVRVCARSHVCA